MEWMMMPYRRYADFSGRSRRKEYWMFVLLSLIVTMICMMLMLGGGMMSAEETGSEPGLLFWLGAGLLGIFVLGSFIPSIAVQVRRFHDQDRSGWMVLLGFIPYVGGLIVFIFMCLDGTRGPNRFGSDPKNPHNADIFA
ncbi:DUF805 domain-containing protein [Novosphingobium taihuense]|uniref:Uncharacterized membrane protein YhaH (DUF805 family) n=1 Tax=Novosphingobium taihuense TaxID=260085 RepID=A0A7W7ADY0_9SPHN|nr:DUF805 domain-containing protein [Novosphingobium taihuense]MBB4615233.1 uncharacterized membrane protein YhaH (DUF805 family) [Novosphingobium taihuense]TWH84268.1 uncharacterized membrane protein YhaH (DUF805 family) [Novosphingobium taihuense]